MRHGGNVIVAVLLTEISTLLGKMGKKNLFGEEVKPGPVNPALCAYAYEGDGLQVSDHTDSGLYRKNRHFLRHSSSTS